MCKECDDAELAYNTKKEIALLEHNKAVAKADYEYRKAIESEWKRFQAANRLHHNKYIEGKGWVQVDYK